ncbi:MAG: IS481 family transposase [Hydrogenothermaceae bacterium]
MKGRVGTPTFIFSLFPKQISKNIKDIRDLPREVKTRIKWIDYFKKTNNVSKTCRHFGISRNTFYKWKKRFDKEGIEGLFDRDKTPKNKRTPTVRKSVRNLVISVRQKFPTWGKEKISAYLKLEEGIEVSASTVYRILKEECLIDKTKKIKDKIRIKKDNRDKKRTRKGLKATFPGEVVQIDVKYIPLGDGTYAYQYVAIDKYSRFSYSHVYPKKNMNNTKDFIEKVREYFGTEIKKVQTDNGSEFERKFSQYLESIGIEHYYSYPRSPKTNAYVERAIRTMEEELWNVYGVNYPIDELNRMLGKYIRKYNFIRPHHSLGYKVPADVFFGCDKIFLG